MSAANVKFFTLDYQYDAGEKPARFSFDCPKGNGRCSGLIIAGNTDIPRDPKGKNGGAAQWDWDKNRQAPTFSPSIDCGGCWHGYIRAGRCVDTNGNDEP